MAGEVRKSYKFGEFHFDAARMRLDYAEETVHLAPKLLEMLKILLERRGETVTREDLIEEVWAQSFVEDSNLTVAVSTLRKTLSNYDKKEVFIQTVPRKGYRFVAEVREQIEFESQPIFLLERAVEQLTIQEDSQQRHSAGFFFTAAALVLTAVIVILPSGSSLEKQVPPVIRHRAKRF